MDTSVLALDEQAEIERIADAMREMLTRQLRRRGLVVGISGGIDSAVCAALCVRAVGPEKVLGLLMPENDSSPNTTPRGRLVAEHLGIEFLTEDISATLKAIGCYSRRDDAIRVVFPDYDGHWPNKLVIRGGADGRINHFAIVVQRPDGRQEESRLPLQAYLQIVAATNFKQRIRKTLEYFHADRLNYAVIGTPNRLEYDQGFFVKNGDGAADIKPIAHLYKTQVYALAEALGIPEDVRQAAPTTDTYSLAQGQDEFYFALPYAKMDLALWSVNHGIPAVDLAKNIDLTVDQAEFVYRDIAAKRRTTAYQHLKSLLIEPVEQITS
ncbi:NAD(+) synthase [Thiocapsa marina]|uniref:NH(3)-dependent NAD(+) synthetase n=1 Tax=Thiocapsa marina 5811 TaxID=768671 RepID=F9UAU2_9GAMM|nr:NAD(+) synthase [Thiocapsa marina]EGV18560.1 NH(3)-dependent NAD(+) synthetase [Thiocapsa marina 5811]